LKKNTPENLEKVVKKRLYSFSRHGVKSFYGKAQFRFLTAILVR
jgi:hypothetical protein